MIELQNDEGASSSFYLEPGVYAKRVIITQVKDLSNYPTLPEKPPVQVGPKKTEPDQCIEVKFEDGDYHKSKMFWRKWNKDKDTKKAIGWATWKNPVLMFFLAALGEDVFRANDDWTIPDAILMEAVHTEVLMVQYQTNRWFKTPDGKWEGYVRDYWPFTFNVTEDKEKIKQLWLDNLSYTNDYARDIALAKENERKENKKSTQIADNESFTKDEDDDLPF